MQLKLLPEGGHIHIDVPDGYKGERTFFQREGGELVCLHQKVHKYPSGRVELGKPCREKIVFSGKNTNTSSLQSHCKAKKSGHWTEVVAKKDGKRGLTRIIYLDIVLVRLSILASIIHGQNDHDSIVVLLQ